MKSTVYFIEAKKKEGTQVLQKKLRTLYDALGYRDRIDKHDVVAVKTHFGEKGNTGVVSPDQIKALVERIKQRNCRVFLTDSTTLYVGERSNAVDYLNHCAAQGFTLERAGAPVVICDGLVGRNEIEVAIDGTHYSRVALSADIVSSSALFVISHFTGHIGIGFGAAIKNLGMGCASRRGKLRQHSDTKPTVDRNRCTACEECIPWCPSGAISMKDEKAYIDSAACIGCAECLTVCRFNAIRHDWALPTKLCQEKCAEHALGAVKAKEGKSAFITSLLHITKDCDCVSGPQDNIVDDVGYLASLDPVAIDQAAVDIVKEKTGVNVPKKAFPEIDYSYQIAHGKAIGLGTDEYELVTL